jgi:hypothetical protein
MMKAMLGGMMMAILPPLAMRAEANPTSYPRATMAGINTVPRAAVSAGPDPEMPAKNTQTTTATSASPPVVGPIRRFTRCTSRCEIPTRSRIRPARMKKGMARSWNLAMLP